MAKTNTKVSIYLVMRAEALIGALRFFSNASARPVRLQFLAQCDYWDWEMDNLIFSFVNFAERSATWESKQRTDRKLATLGIAVSTKVLSSVRPSGAGWSLRRTTTRTVPTEMLREAVDLWNQLLETVEAELLAPMRREVERWNVQAVTDLTRLRKTMPDLGELNAQVPSA